MKLINSIINLFSRSKSDIFLIFESLYYLLSIKIKLSKNDFNILAKNYQLQKINQEIVFDTIDYKQLKSISWAVERSSLLLPWDGLCLVKALCAYKMLKKRAISANIFMGVKKEENSLKAHAWLKYNDLILTGKKGHKDFTVVSIFTWEIL